MKLPPTDVLLAPLLMVTPAPEPTDPDPPVICRLPPLPPVAAPDTTEIPPDDPALVAPVVMLVDPLTPDGPPAPEATLILPDELAIPFPLVSETDPPDNPVSDAPALIDSDPPTPVSPEPTISVTSPPTPTAASPDTSETWPESPSVEVPELSVIRPLAPLDPASRVASSTLPEDVAAPLPE